MTRQESVGKQSVEKDPLFYLGSTQNAGSDRELTVGRTSLHSQTIVRVQKFASGSHLEETDKVNWGRPVEEREG